MIYAVVLCFSHLHSAHLEWSCRLILLVCRVTFMVRYVYFCQQKITQKIGSHTYADVMFPATSF